MNKKLIGIIVEFNPLHTGHKHLIDSIEAAEPDATIVASMSGNFVQRGELAIYDKWTRAEYAVEYGVDLVLELPPYYVLNNANIFASKSVSLLYSFGVRDIYFGSETLTIEDINVIVNDSIKQEDKLTELKKKLHSLPKAFEELVGKTLNPNDILGICYVMEAKKLGLDITFHRVERKHGEQFTSASKIREGIWEGNDNIMNLSFSKRKYKLDDYSDVILGKLITSKSEDNVINYLKKSALDNSVTTVEQLIELSANKGYTKARLRRDLMKFILELEGTDQVIVLATNDQGKEVLKNNTGYSFRHEKDNNDNYNVERFISIKTKSSLSKRLSKNTIFVEDIRQEKQNLEHKF